MSKWDEKYKRNLAAYDEQIKKQFADNDTLHQGMKDSVQSTYEGSIADQNEGYEELSRANEVQKYINAREVAENNANLGLTDSGLNRTQQTAVQLSASNEEARIQRARQSAVAALTREMNAKFADIETSRLSSRSSIQQGYEKLASDAATSEVKAELEAENERIKAAGDSLKQYRNAYSKLISDAADIDESAGDDIKLAKLYDFIDSYDVDLEPENNYTNAELRELLKLYGVDNSTWRNYFIQRTGIKTVSDTVPNVDYKTASILAPSGVSLNHSTQGERYAEVFRQAQKNPLIVDPAGYARSIVYGY